jgi:TldD protein
VIDLHTHPDRRLAGLELPGERFETRCFGPREDARCRQDLDVTGAQGHGSVEVGHLALDTGSQPGVHGHRRYHSQPPAPEVSVLDHELINRTLGTALRTGGDFAEVFVEDKRSSSAMLDDGRVEELTSGRDRGAGIRVVVGDTTGFAHTADLSEKGLAKAAAAAAAAARGGGGGVREVSVRAVDTGRPGPVRIPPEDVAKATKVELLSLADAAARGEGSAITQVSARYGDSRRRILVANSDGLLAEDDQVRTLFSVSCVATGDSGLQTGRESTGRTVGFELFEEADVEEMARRAADRAITKLAARPAPSGAMPVVVGPGGGGVLFHEACGHGLEADLVAKSASVFAGRVGEAVATPLVTLIDDGTMAGEWGHFTIDDEGRPAAHNVLIQDGVLTDYMWDHLRARKDGRQSSGNGRRQSYQHLPMVRMTNTYISNGTDDPADIISGTDHGVYVAQLGGGQVNTATGDFVFGMTEAYLIENGEVTEPIREGNLIGNGPEVLTRIDALGNDFAMGSPGTCGKDGQGVPVGDGTPTLRVTSLTVGGTAA